MYMYDDICIVHIMKVLFYFQWKKTGEKNGLKQVSNVGKTRRHHDFENTRVRVDLESSGPVKKDFVLDMEIVTHIC